MSVGAPLPRLMLGDNQFFGVNHMSEERARAQLMRFQRIESIMNVLDSALDLGITTFMCTTHDRVGEICDIARADPDRYGELQFQPCMPYAHKYANSVTEDGFVGAIRKLLPPEGLLSAAVRGGKSLASRDIEGIATLLIDAEMKMMHDLPTPVVWMQNVVVDLLVGLGMHEALSMFANHVERRYQAQPGFITMNLNQTLDALESAGVENPLVCANINKIGFRMSGGIEGYRRALEERPFRAVAMSVFASGAIPPQEALEWICEQPAIESIVFGASSRSTLASTKGLVAEFWTEQPTAPTTVP
jgi:hypothetical protein